MGILLDLFSFIVMFCENLWPGVLQRFFYASSFGVYASKFQFYASHLRFYASEIRFYPYFENSKQHFYKNRPLPVWKHTATAGTRYKTASFLQKILFSQVILGFCISSFGNKLLGRGTWSPCLITFGKKCRDTEPVPMSHWDAEPVPMSRRFNVLKLCHLLR